MRRILKMYKTPISLQPHTGVLEDKLKLWKLSEKKHLLFNLIFYSLCSCNINYSKQQNDTIDDVKINFNERKLIQFIF